MADPTKPIDPKVAAERERKRREKEQLKNKHDREKKSLALKYKKDKKPEETLPYDPVKEASMKANKLHIMHSAKQIAKMKSGHEKENAITDLEKKAKKMGFDRADYEKIIDGQGAYEETIKKVREEAETMNGYLNILSLERSVNLWAEAAKSKDEDLEPVKGSKTLTKKTQEKVTINPMEKEYNRR